MHKHEWTLYAVEHDEAWAIVAVCHGCDEPKRKRVYLAADEIERRLNATEALGEFEARIASRACATGMPPDNTAQFPRVAECLSDYARVLSDE